MILVTGGSGLIGGHLVEVLCSRGERVRRLERRKLNTQAEVVLGDLVSGAGVEEALEGVDRVIHLAGLLRRQSRGLLFGECSGYRKVGAGGGDSGIRMVHVSSLAAVGPSLDGMPVGEDDEARPVPHHGKSKLEGERMVRKLLPEAVVARPPAVYGPRDRSVSGFEPRLARTSLFRSGWRSGGLARSMLGTWWRG